MALALTVLAAIILFLWLRLAHVYLSAYDHIWPERQLAEVVIDNEMFFDVVGDVVVPDNADGEPAPAETPVAENNQSVPAPESGTDMTSQGEPAEPPQTVTSRQPAPVKAPETPPAKTGPTKEEIEAAEARRKANETVNSAFSHTSGDDNTANQGENAGDSGSPAGTGSFHGSGTGSVGGGWFMPEYAKVPSTITGSIRVMVKINSEGAVTSVNFLGGDPPASTDKALRAAVEAEVRSKKFTRGVSPAPEQSTAYITYRFR